jgi:drug/metabolite transporter (DMT)-like permease
MPGMPAPSDPGRLARGAAIAGLVGAGVMIAGTLAIELADRPASEDVTRGLHLGFTALAAPLVAYAAYTVRRRERVEGNAVLRSMGWGFYASAIALGVAQWYDALHDRNIPHGYGYLYGSLAVLSLLPHCFDAYITARSARVPLLVVMPNGLLAKF